MRLVIIIVTLAVASLVAASICPTAHDSGADDTVRPETVAYELFGTISPAGALGIMYDVFTENAGQAPNPEILFHSASGSMAFTNCSAILYVEAGGGPDTSSGNLAAVKFSFEGANSVTPVGMDPTPWRSNFLRGNDSANWQRNIVNYRTIVYRDLWDGIDLVYRLQNKSLKYDIVVHPYSDHTQIRIKVEGQEHLSLNEGGALDIEIGPGRSITDSGLDVFYAGLETEKIDASFMLADNDIYTFMIAGRDPARTVVIDPLVYSTYLGGAGTDVGTDIAVGADGAAYVTGYTDSMNFTTTPGILKDDLRPDHDIFVSKIDATGQSLEYSTFIGGADYDVANAVAVDADGCAHLAGLTYSADYPVTAGAVDTSYDGVGDAFVTKLGAEGDIIVYSTFLGGKHDEEGCGMTLDSEGQAYVTGHTWSADFPTTNGSYSTQINGDSDAFIAKLSSHGDILIYSTYLGGAGSDRGADVAVRGGSAYVTGTTRSANFPTLPDSLNITGAREDTFSVKLSQYGSSLEYSVRLGGDGNDTACGISTDSEGRAYLAGVTDSANFPVTANAFDSTHNGGKDLFMVCINRSGEGLHYSTFVGGALDEAIGGIAVDQEGCAHVTGQTVSADFPTTEDAEDSALSGSSDAFMAKLGSAGGALLYSSFLGGSTEDAGSGIDLASDGCVFIVGQTLSTDFPTTPSAPGMLNNGAVDAFVAKSDITVPVADAGPDITVNESNTVTFNGTSSRDNVGITNYSWTVFNGTEYLNLSGAAPQHFFKVPGNYSVTLLVSDAVGNQAADTLNLTVLVYPIPIAEAGPDITIGASDFTILNGSASRDNEAVVGYSWTFSDGTNSNITICQASPAWSFKVPGVYEARLTVHDADNNFDTDSVNVTVTDTGQPVAEPGPNLEIPRGSAAVFNGSASSDDIGIVNYSWTFMHNGTQVVLYGSNPTYGIWSPGTTVVTLTVQDAAGNSGSNVMAVTTPSDDGGYTPVTWAGIILVILALALIGTLMLSGGRTHGPPSEPDEISEDDEGNGQADPEVKT